MTRAKLAEFCAAPWFGEWVTGAFGLFESEGGEELSRNAGAWVRYLIGEDKETREPVYRLCQVTGALLPRSPPALS